MRVVVATVLVAAGAVLLAAGGTADEADAPELLPVDTEVPPPPAEPVVVGDRAVRTVHDEGNCSVMQAVEGDEIRVLVAEGCPDRVALAPDGEWVAYVGGATGIASVYLVPFAGGEPVQLTNVGLEDAPLTIGRPPDGFVPPPHAGAPWFDGGRLHWRSPRGPESVALP